MGNIFEQIEAEKQRAQGGNVFEQIEFGKKQKQGNVFEQIEREKQEPKPQAEPLSLGKLASAAASGVASTLLPEPDVTEFAGSIAEVGGTVMDVSGRQTRSALEALRPELGVKEEMEENPWWVNILTDPLTFAGSGTGMTLTAAITAALAKRGIPKGIAAAAKGALKKPQFLDDLIARFRGKPKPATVKPEVKPPAALPPTPEPAIPGTGKAATADEAILAEVDEILRPPKTPEQKVLEKLQPLKAGKIPEKAELSIPKTIEVKPPPPPLPATDKKAFNINLERLNLSPEEKGIVKATVKDIKPELERVKGKTLTNAEVVRAAQESEMLQETVGRGSVLRSTATMLKTRQHLAALAQGKGVSEDFIETLKIVSSEAASRGRELQALKISADPILGEKNIKTKLVKKLLDLGHDTDEIIEAAKDVDFDNARQVGDFYRKFVKPGLSEIIDEYRYINLLSSPRTHIVNAFSNLTQAFSVAPGTKLTSGLIDAVASGLTGKARQHYVAEVPAYFRGMFNSLNRAVSDVGKIMRGQQMLGRPDIAQIPTQSKLLAFGRPIVRALEAGDVFFRTLVKGGEVESLSLKYARQGVKKTSEEIAKEAAEKGQYYVFRAALDPKNKGRQGYLLSNIDKMTDAIYKLRKVPLVKWFIPFVQTPMNIFKQGIEFSPLGTATVFGAGNKIEQLGKAFLGSSVFAGSGFLALQGKTTWAAPTSEEERKVFYASGRQPYSLQIGDEWISYSRLGTLAYPIALAAAYQWHVNENPKRVNQTALETTTRVFAGIAQFFSNQSYVQGLGDFVDAASGEAYAISRALSNLPSQLIPLSSFQRWAGNVIDPIYRRGEKGISSEAIVQNLMKTNPWLRQELPTYETPTGEPSERKLALLNAFLPVDVTPVDERYTEELLKGRKIKERLAGRQGEKEVLHQEAEETWEKWKDLPREKRFEQYTQVKADDPALAKRLISIGQDEKRGLSYTERLMGQLQVGTGDRARFIVSELDKLEDPEEKFRYYRDLKQKKLISERVALQIRILRVSGK